MRDKKGSICAHCQHPYLPINLADSKILFLSLNPGNKSQREVFLAPIPVSRSKVGIIGPGGWMLVWVWVNSTTIIRLLVCLAEKSA